MDSSNGPVVFLSYSHDSDEHARRVLELSRSLREQGVHTILDQYETSPPEGWARWMERWLREAEFVLVICSSGYIERVTQLSSLGVPFEHTLVLQYIFEDHARNHRFIPVLLAGGETAHVPVPLRSGSIYRWTSASDRGKLIRRVFREPEVTVDPIGKVSENRRARAREPRTDPVDSADRAQAEQATLRQVLVGRQSAFLLTGCDAWTLFEPQPDGDKTTALQALQAPFGKAILADGDLPVVCLFDAVATLERGLWQLRKLEAPGISLALTMHGPALGTVVGNVALLEANGSKRGALQVAQPVTGLQSAAAGGCALLCADGRVAVSAWPDVRTTSVTFVDLDGARAVALAPCADDRTVLVSLESGFARLDVENGTAVAVSNAAESSIRRIVGTEQRTLLVTDDGRLMMFDQSLHPLSLHLPDDHAVFVGASVGSHGAFLAWTADGELLRVGADLRVMSLPFAGVLHAEGFRRSQRTLLVTRGAPELGMQRVEIESPEA